MESKTLQAPQQAVVSRALSAPPAAFGTLPAVSRAPILGAGSVAERLRGPLNADASFMGRAGTPLPFPEWGPTILSQQSLEQNCEERWALIQP